MKSLLCCFSSLQDYESLKTCVVNHLFSDVIRGKFKHMRSLVFKRTQNSKMYYPWFYLKLIVWTWVNFRFHGGARSHPVRKFLGFLCRNLIPPNIAHYPGSWVSYLIPPNIAHYPGSWNSLDVFYYRSLISKIILGAPSGFNQLSADS